MKIAEFTLLGVKKSYIQGASTVHVLNGIDATFQQGFSYAIHGVSGAGKSTILHLLSALDTPSSGTVQFNNRTLSTFSPSERSYFLNKEIGIVLQEPYLIAELTVLENIMLKGLLYGEDAEECKKKARALLDQLELCQTHEQRLPKTLSGGQQQRVSLARALFNKPLFLLADEPTANLDEETGYKIINLLVSLQTEWKMGIVVSTHSPYVAQQMDITYQLHAGLLHKLKNVRPHCN